MSNGSVASIAVRVGRVGCTTEALLDIKGEGGGKRVEGEGGTTVDPVTSLR